jgi:fibronectin type 3 domain-containing protein
MGVRARSRIILTLFLVVVLTLSFNVALLKAESPINGGAAARETLKYSGVSELSGVAQSYSNSCCSSYDVATHKISVTYYFSEPTIEDSCACIPSSPSDVATGYVSVKMSDLPQCEETGLPVLPFRTAKVLLPFGTLLERISVTGGKRVTLSNAYLVEYGQKAVRLDSVDSAEALEESSPDETVYGSSQAYPGELYSDVSVQSKMGYSILLVNIFPVEYVPKTGQLSYYESISVQVEVSSERGSKASAFDASLQRREMVEGIVDNAEVFETYLDAISPRTEETSTYQYVIITNEELNSTPGPYNFQALRDDKISRGISATIVTVEWIYANYDGARPDGGEDDQTKIRNFIIDAYNNWGTMYVLLGGDGDRADLGDESGDLIIPHRGFYASYDVGKYDDDIPADMYYGCLDGTFDYDGDGVYGETNDGVGGGEVDLFAEVYVGRACVDSQAEVQNFVYKTLSYEAVPPTDVNLRKVWMVGEDMDPWSGVARWAGNFNDEIKEGSSAHGYTTVGFEDSPYATGLDVSTLYDRDYLDNDWPKSEIVGAINDNAHLINHLGHGNLAGPLMKMNNFDVDTQLTNDELFFIGYSQGCYCGAFDNKFASGAYYSQDCIVEHLTTGAHGAAAFIANSRYGLGRPDTTDGPSQHFDREFWDAVLGEDIFNIGIANQDSKEDSAGRVSSQGDRFCYYEINLFGDPELRIVLPPADEHELTVKVDAPIYSNQGDRPLLNATVYNRGWNMESDVELFLMINDTIVTSATIPELLSGESRTISYSWNPTTEGTYNITAYAPSVPNENNIENNVKSTNALVQAWPDILIVDDNDGTAGWNYLTSLPQFESALTDAGYNYLVWNESALGDPGLDFLNLFKLVIWTCGDYYNYAVDLADAATLECYLAQGGNILLEGEDIGATHQLDANFMEDVAHAVWGVRDTSPVAGLTVTDSGHPVTQGLPASFDWYFTPKWPDGVSPTNGGADIIKYAETSWTAVTVFGGLGGGSVVYYAFPLHCLNPSEAETLTINSVEWLLTETYAFDFGTSFSPTKVGYTQVSNSTGYSAVFGYGWSSTENLYTRDRGAPDDLRRDFVCGNLTGGSTFNVDLANGDYLVTVIIGDQGSMHDKIDVYAEDELVINDLTAQAGSFQEVTFAASVADGQLNLRVLDDGGVDPNWVLNMLSIVVAPPPATGGSFDFGTGSSAVEAGYTGVSPSTVYSLSLGYGWSTAAGLDSRDRGGPDDLMCDFLFGASDSTFNVDLADGDYLVIAVIGDQNFMHDQIDVYAEDVPVVNDLTVSAGSFQEVSFKVTIVDGQLNLRILDDGGVDPNWVLNALIIVVAPPPPTEAAFDFGTQSSAVEAGYIQVSPLTGYSAVLGYGWASTAGLDSRDRGSPNDLNRDFVFSSTEHTFNVDLANGYYLVTVVVGDQAFGHDKIDVYAEENLVVNDLTAAAGSFQEVTFTTTVTDGQLNVRILDDGGSDGNWVLNALTIEGAPPPPTEASFDFGTGSSPVEAGYIQVTEYTLYSGASGYGWVSTSGLSSRDRGVPDDLRSDFVFSSAEKTFSVDLANGVYQLTVVMGDHNFRHDNIDVYAEGVLVINDLTASAGSFQEETFTTTITDGQLNLRILDDGGADVNWVLNALTINAL